ncbi:hypothetical protein CR513_41018, partial [Mucuna pruriens]
SQNVGSFLLPRYISNAFTFKEAWEILVKTYGDGEKNKKDPRNGQFHEGLQGKDFKSVRGRQDIIKKLQHSLEAHEIRVNKRKKRNKSNTNQKHHDQASSETSEFNESSKGRRKDQAQKQGCNSKNNKEWQLDKRKVRCHNFQKLGYYARECWTREGVKNKHKIHANMVQDEGSNSDSEAMMLLATTCNEASNDTSWYLDLGRVCFANNMSLTVEGTTGKVVFRNKDGRETVIEEVLYVLGIKTNLLEFGLTTAKRICHENGGQMPHRT